MFFAIGIVGHVGTEHTLSIGTSPIVDMSADSRLPSISGCCPMGRDSGDIPPYSEG